jgi:hypothetical protein
MQSNNNFFYINNVKKKNIFEVTIIEKKTLELSINKKQKTSNMKKIILTLLTISFLCSTTEAKYVQTCKVKYKKNYEWSDFYTVEVTFMSGTELNRAIKTYEYDSYSTYAIIFWDKDQASVIKISTYVGCGTEVTQSCISNKVTNLEGEDQKGKGWEICAKNLCY